MPYASGYRNLELSLSQAVNCIVPKQPVQLYVWTGQTNTKGVMTPTYAEPVSFMSSVQQETNQNLIHLLGYDITSIYYRFYLQSDTVSGLNRPGGHAQDYIMWNGKKFTIVSLFDKYETGWSYVLAVQQ